MPLEFSRSELLTFGVELEIRVVMGLYDHLLTGDGRRTFEETEWTLTPTADRVGFRYKGAKLDLLEREQPFGAGSDPSNIVDAPYPIGSIQIPGGIEPIVLHRDAVSGGGYAMIATVISADMDTVAQSAAPIVILQFLNGLGVGIESVEVREHRIPLDRTGVFDAQMVRIGEHALHFLRDDVARVREIDRVTQRLAHLGISVGAGQEPRGRDERFAFDEHLR